MAARRWPAGKVRRVPTGRGRVAWLRAGSRGLILLLTCAALGVSTAQAGSSAERGEAIYRQGILSSGKPLVGVRGGGLRLTGKTVACVSCHQRSGLGSTEGQTIVPPITLRYLFFDPQHPTQQDLDLPYVEGIRIERQPYTRKTLARAIRQGIGADGKPLDYMMPHYDLNDADMAALIHYLGRLDEHNHRGVTHTVLHFATIITPDADPVERKGMLDVMHRFFADKDMAPVGATPRLRSSRKFKFWVNPRWKLHVWQLHGPAKTWKAQLEQDLKREPVFAVVSGLGGGNWAPVHQFCEEQKLPCLFPNVAAPPPGADHDFYSLYYTRGVGLEADLIAQRLRKLRHATPGRHRTMVVRQIYRAGRGGGLGARELTAALRGQDFKVETRRLARGKSGKGVRAAVRSAAHADVLVLWLRPADISALGKTPPKGPAIYLSGLLGGLEQAPLPAAWRKRAHLSYPVGLPAQRRIAVDFALGWFRIRHIPLVAERVQADTYLTCSILGTTLHQMVDTFVPDYFIERIEAMLDDRIITGYYPHLTLATDQRFASKGGYIVHLDDKHPTAPVAEGGWTIPQPAMLGSGLAVR